MEVIPTNTGVEEKLIQEKLTQLREVFMTACLESTRQSKMDPVTSNWKLTVNDRRLMWLQKKHPGACGNTLQLWAAGAFKESHDSPKFKAQAS